MPFINPYLEIVHPLLVELNLEIVYIGGAVIPLYVPELTKSHGYRETLDIDVIVLALSNYWDLPDLEKQLSKQGITPSMDPGDPRCRYILNHTEKGPIKIDILATNSDVHGFPCDWFIDAAQNTEERELKSGMKILIPQITYMMALKLKAFFDRGVNAFDSKDLQDIILLLTVEENRKELRIKTPNSLVSQFVWDSFGKLAQSRAVIDYIEGDFRSDEEEISMAIIRFINMPLF